MREREEGGAFLGVRGRERRLDNKIFTVASLNRDVCMFFVSPALPPPTKGQFLRPHNICCNHNIIIQLGTVHKLCQQPKVVGGVW